MPAGRTSEVHRRTEALRRIQPAVKYIIAPLKGSGKTIMLKTTRLIIHRVGRVRDDLARPKRPNRWLPPARKYKNSLAA